MPVILLVIAILLFVSAYRGVNSISYLASNLEQDVAGFFVWALAIIVIGAIGLIPNMRKVSNALLVLVILVIALKNGQGFFANLQNVKSSIQAPPAETPLTAPGSAPGPGTTQAGAAAPTVTGTPEINVGNTPNVLAPSIVPSISTPLTSILGFVGL